MRARELPTSELLVVELTALQPRSAPDWLGIENNQQRLPEVIIEPAESSGGDVVVRPANGMGAEIRAQLVPPAELTWVLATDVQLVCWVAKARRTGATGYRLTVQVHSFAQAGGFPARLDIGIDDPLVDQVRALIRNERADLPAVRAWLAEEFLLDALPGEPRRLIYSAGPGGTDNSSPAAFTLHGRRWAADVRVREERTIITRMTMAAQRGHRWLRLAMSQLDFVNATRQELLGRRLQAQLAGLATSGRSYLELWDEYNSIEREYLITRAREFGYAAYTGCRPTGDGGFHFDLAHGSATDGFLRNVARTSERELTLEAATTRPLELFGDDEPKAGRHDRSWVGVVIDAPDRDGRTIQLRDPERTTFDGGEPPHEGWLFIALAGSRTQLDRRKRARDRIAENRAEMPGLSLLLEGISIPPPPTHRRRKLSTLLTKAVRDRFGGEPTTAQKMALERAVNTPDIVLVQGPPGTGKTQFIAALQECLSEMDSRMQVIGERLLLTSYQHDAVDHVARKSHTKEGIPALKIDSRKRGTRETVDGWRESVLAAVNEQIAARPAAGPRDKVARLRRLAAGYDQAPYPPASLLDLLDEVGRLAGDQLSLPDQERLARLRIATQATIAAASHGYVRQVKAAARAIRALRVSRTAFADDGPDRARDAARQLAEYGLLDAADNAVLERAAGAGELADQWLAGEDGDGEQLLREQRELRLRLLHRLFAAGPTMITPARDPEMQRLLHDIVATCEAEVSRSPDGIAEVLLGFRDDLESDREYVERTLRAYGGILAATCQQVDSQEMFRVMNAPLAAFGTVIIDEAARANPLDLMIPMACGRGRIVLVGDHRQLPHALDLHVQQQLDRRLTSGDAVAGGDLIRSLFERWYELFEPDKQVPRTIRLDEQFRMHPTLGKFVSRVFYGSADAVRSHPSTDALVHDLEPYRGRVAAWIDVPLGDGAEERAGHSFYRTVEADRLADELAMLARLDRDKKLSFGVISFYSAQVDQMWRSLAKSGLAVPDDETPGKYRPDREMERTEDGRDRLRVGTVDAFQGMEFDVVLLSVTRSNRPRRELRPRARWGHLFSENRMCVAMSRQRRLLLVVGDSAMADRATAPVLESEQPGAAPGRSLIEGLVAFRELCAELGG